MRWVSRQYNSILMQSCLVMLTAKMFMFLGRQSGDRQLSNWQLIGH